MKTKSVILACATLAVLSGFAGESVADKPTGFRFFNRHLTVKPYVALQYTYDSNIDSTKHAEADSIFAVNPGLDFEWRGERWALVGSVWYRYNAYAEHNSEMGENSYGERLAYKWSTSDAGTKGWSLMLQESFAHVSQSDSLQNGGRGVWRDREPFAAAGALERRFTDRLHADLSAQYDYLDYINDSSKYAPLYGWSEFSFGGEVGYAASKWTDILLALGYSRYHQHGGQMSHDYSTHSDSFSVMGGLGSHATEKITYRALIGGSWLDYGGHSGSDKGWTYSLSANWRVTRQFQASVLGSSYYQPSERSLGSARKMYSMSVGGSYLTMGDKMTLTANLAYRHEVSAYSDRYASDDYDLDYISARLGATYVINRWVSAFGDIEWQEEWNDNHDDYNYDRFRGTLGLRFHY